MAKSPFLNSIREFMLVRHYSLRTINTYIYWIHQYLIFHHKQHPHKLSSQDVEQFLTHWSVKECRFCNTGDCLKCLGISV